MAGTPTINFILLPQELYHYRKRKIYKYSIPVKFYYETVSTKLNIKLKQFLLYRALRVDEVEDLAGGGVVNGTLDTGR